MPRPPAYPGARELSDRRDAFFHECSAKFYHHVPDRASSTILKECLRSGAHAQQQINHPKPETDAMQFGTLVHYIFENPEWRDVIKTMPKFDGRKPKERAAKKEFLELNKDCLFASAEQMRSLVRIEKNYQSRPNLMALLDGARHEVSGFWTGRYEVPCKFRADVITPDNVIIDFKTCPDASKFKWDVLKWKYHLQAAFYLEGLSAILKQDLQEFIWVAIENTSPHGIKVFHCERETLDEGRKLVSDAMLVYKENHGTEGLWPDYPDVIEPLTIFN